MRRPKPIAVADVSVRVVRGPDGAGRWYWRADRPDGSGGRTTVWSGWAAVAEVGVTVAGVVAGATEAKPEPGLVTTVRDLLEYWIGSYEQREDTARRTLPTVRSAARRLVDVLGDTPIARLDRAVMERARDVRLRKGHAANTIMRDWKHLRTAWRWGRELGIVPLRDLPTVRIERAGRTRVYTEYTPTPDEVARLVEALPEGWRRDVLVLLRATGARIGEVAAIRWGDVAPDGSAVVVGGKTGSRRVPLPAGTVARLTSWGVRRAAGVSVWPVSATRIEARWGVELGALSERLGLGGRVTPHGIRRSVTDALYRAGVAPEVEAALLGHSPATALTHYRRVSGEEAAAAVARTPLLPGDDRDDRG